jgi:outer membrane lipoprotein-sorting protein
MNDNEKKLEQYLKGIDFDDAPDSTHRDLLEKKLLLNFSAPSSRPNIKWRTIMQSKITQKAIAAIVIIAALVLVVFPSGSSIAWADVVEQINNYTRYKCRQRVVREKGPELPTMDVYHLNLSQRRQETVSGDIHIIDMRGEDAITVELKPSEMTATVTKLVGFGPRKDPHIIAMVKKFDQKSTERLGTKEVNGKTLQGFRHSPNKGNEFTVWVDPKTKLPVEIELKHLKSPFGQTLFLDEFEFDFELDESAFSTEIPAGYEITTLTQDYRKVDPKVLTAEEFKSAISHTAYTVEKLDWIKKQVFMQTLDPLGTRTKSYLSVLKADDGNTILLMHDDYYKQEIMVWIQKQEMVLEAMGGLKVYTHPNGKIYAEKFLKAAAKTVPDYINTEDISDERFTMMIAMPDGMVVGLVSNKKLDDVKLQQLVEALVVIE